MAAPPPALLPSWRSLGSASGLQGIWLTSTWKLIRSQCSWPEERRAALLVYRSPPSSRWARGVYRLSSMVALYLMPGGRRGQDHGGGATFPPKTVYFPLQIAFGKSASSRKPSRMAKEELLPSPRKARAGRRLPHGEQENREKSQRKEPERRGRQKEEKGRWN